MVSRDSEGIVPVDMVLVWSEDATKLLFHGNLYGFFRCDYTRGAML